MLTRFPVLVVQSRGLCSSWCVKVYKYCCLKKRDSSATVWAPDAPLFSAQTRQSSLSFTSDRPCVSLPGVATFIYKYKEVLKCLFFTFALWHPGARVWFVPHSSDVTSVYRTLLFAPWGRSQPIRVSYTDWASRFGNRCSNRKPKKRRNSSTLHITFMVSIIWRGKFASLL